MKKIQKPKPHEQMIGLNIRVDQLTNRVIELESTVNEFLDLIVREFEKSIGSNFAAPFKAHLKKLADKYGKEPTNV